MLMLRRREKKKSPLVHLFLLTLKPDTPPPPTHAYMRGTIFKSTSLPPHVNESLSLQLGRDNQLFVSFFFSPLHLNSFFVIFCIMSAATLLYHQQASCLSVKDHQLHTVSTLTPQQPLQAEGSTITASSSQRCLITVIVVEAAKGSREMNPRDHEMSNSLGEQGWGGGYKSIFISFLIFV